MPVTLRSSFKRRVTCGEAKGHQGVESRGTYIFPFGSPRTLPVETHAILDMLLEAAAETKHCLFAEDHTGVVSDRRGRKRSIENEERGRDAHLMPLCSLISRMSSSARSLDSRGLMWSKRRGT